MFKSFAVLVVSGLLACAAVMATRADDAPVDPRVELAAKLPGKVKPEELSPTPIPGVYELRRGTDIGYVSSDGRYYLSGELIDLDTSANLTESRLKEVRKTILAAVPESEMIVFGPQSKYSIVVFTDVDCGYCRKLHNEIAQFNQLGIQVRYMSYPRAGPGSPSWKTAEDIWCASDRKEALTRAKRGEAVPSHTCRSNPVAKQFALGNTLGVHGTPGIFTKNGDYLSGYLPPQQMLARLQRLGAG